MTERELEHRMLQWLTGEYHAIIVELHGEVVGYALYRFEPDHVYLRQLYVVPEHRREKIGQKTVRWLMDNAFRGAGRVRLDVLVGNAVGIAYWRAIGFEVYCVTMELNLPREGQNAVEPNM